MFPAHRTREPERASGCAPHGGSGHGRPEPATKTNTAWTLVSAECGERGHHPVRPPRHGAVTALSRLTLTGVAHAASRACRLHARLGTRPQEPIGDRVLHDDVFHPGDVQKRQQHPQELRRRGRVGESLMGFRAALSGSPQFPETQAASYELSWHW